VRAVPVAIGIARLPAVEYLLQAPSLSLDGPDVNCSQAQLHKGEQQSLYLEDREGWALAVEEVLNVVGFWLLVHWFASCGSAHGRNAALYLDQNIFLVIIAVKPSAKNTLTR
jgi:hypothetical protein